MDSSSKSKRTGRIVSCAKDNGETPVVDFGDGYGICDQVIEALESSPQRLNMTLLAKGVGS